MKKTDRGVLTIAYGSKKYLRMGRALAFSVHHHDAEARLAVVTDTPSYFDDVYDHVVPVDLSYGSGVTQKLHLDRYSPFEETLFIDSDCLLYDSLAPLWAFFAVEDGFGVRSWGPLTRGDQCQGVRDFDRYLDYFGLEGIPNLKGGFYYFNDSEASTQVFRTARRVYEVRDEAGLTSFKNAAVADEAVIATAMRHCGIDPIPLASPDDAPVNTFLGRTEPVEINVLEGKSRFIKNGTPVESAAVHYPIGTHDGYCYLRDVHRLEFKEQPAAELRARVAAGVEIVSRPMAQKWENVRTRVSEIGPLGVLPGRVLRRFDIGGIEPLEK